ncbi:MAG: hypothetical protein J6K15_05170 [Lachnospiraceae bacterium]|nr:hypothetical protein [Lachnospiraceae bacterium]
MNKHIEKVEKYKEKTLKTALEKLKAEYAEAEDFYTDTGYDKYYNKMNKCEAQIEEIEEYMSRGQEEKRVIATDEYKELLQLREKMKCVKNKVFYLSKELPMCADLIGLMDILRDF